MVALPCFLQIKKRIPKPLPSAYPEKLVTIGDHMRRTRLDRNLYQKDVGKLLGIDGCTVKNWEKVSYTPRICEFLNYTPLIQNQTKHFGHQLRYYRIYILGLSAFDFATTIDVCEETLNEIEQHNIIRSKRVFNSISLFLKHKDWEISDKTGSEFVPKQTKRPHLPRFNIRNYKPETLGEHIALKRKQLKLTQAQAMSQIGVVSISAYRSWERYEAQPHVRFYPKIMEFLNYCPVYYSVTEGQRLKLMREHMGLSYREVDKLLRLSKGCTYRVEVSNNLNLEVTNILKIFYRTKIEHR